MDLITIGHSGLRMTGKDFLRLGSTGDIQLPSAGAGVTAREPDWVLNEDNEETHVSRGIKEEEMASSLQAQNT